MNDNDFEYLRDKIGHEWFILLSDKMKLHLHNILLKIEGLRKRYIVYPFEDDMFTIFKLLKPNDVKVVIMGQDPYHDGNATGVAFGCKFEKSPTLISINSRLKLDFPELVSNKDIKLNYLVKQGVFLINRVLTVEEGHPASHSRLQWDVFVLDILSILNQRDNIVFMFWGKHAMEMRLPVTNPKNIRLYAEHPMKPVYEKREWRCNNFRECNNYLITKKITPINWW